MKPFAFLLALSVAANAALAILFIRSSSVGSEKTSQAAVVAKADGRPGGTASIVDGATAASAVDAKTWNNLQTSDLKAMVERLRAAGFPPAVIRAMIAALIDEKYAARRKALLADQKEQPFWERNAYSAYDPKLLAAMRELGRQQMKEIKDLLGTDGMSGNELQRAWQRRQFGDLPADKLEQMQNIVSDYGDMRSEIYAKANGVMLPEDREKLVLLEKEQRADLASVLTPEELENYELRSSSTANAIRSQLSIFKPTEAEFRAMFEATRAAEAQYGTLTNGPTSSDQAEKIRNSVLASLQPQMSPERYAELNQATDPKYQMANRLVARLDLPAKAAIDLVAIQQDAMQRATTIRRDTSLSAEQRSDQLAALAQDATGKLIATLTPRGLEAYKQYGGNWLQSLTPPARPPTAAKP